MPSDPVQFVLLMRHGEFRDGHLTAAATKHLGSLAARLAEWLAAEWRDAPDRRVQLVTLTTSATDEVAATAERLVESLVETRHLEQTTQDWGVDLTVGAYEPAEDAVRTYLADLRRLTTPTHSPLLVTNAPLVEWLAALLVGSPFPIAHGELVCLRRLKGDRWEVCWTISADGPDEASAIRDKIKSKMTVATALGAVIVSLLTFVIKDVLPGANAWRWGAAAALALASVLYFATLFLYDTLQMPPRFWASRLSGVEPTTWARRLRHGKRLVTRPPSAAARVLHAAMVQVWVWVFTPATVLVGVGVVLLGIGAAEPSSADPLLLEPWQVALGALTLGLLGAGWIAVHRPDLGSAD